MLIEYFSTKISNSYNLKKLNIRGDNSYLINHSWPGNVRELRNLIERIAILANNNSDKISTIIKESIKQEENEIYSESNFSVPLKEARENFEKDYLTTQLKNLVEMFPKQLNLLEWKDLLYIENSKILE